MAILVTLSSGEGEGSGRESESRESKVEGVVRREERTVTNRGYKSIDSKRENASRACLLSYSSPLLSALCSAPCGLCPLSCYLLSSSRHHPPTGLVCLLPRPRPPRSFLASRDISRLSLLLPQSADEQVAHKVTLKPFSPTR
jgi:hypothetical protein